MRREGNFDLSTECFKLALKFTEEEKLLQATRALKYELANKFLLSSSLFYSILISILFSRLFYHISNYLLTLIIHHQ